MKKGKLIVIYGINRIGKTTQTKKLIKYLRKKGYKAEYVKIPHYKLKPTGQIINKILRRKKQTISEEEFQLLYVLNRLQFQPILIKKLKKGINIISEDYVGTGLVWGSIKGADYNWLKEINKPLIKEDTALLLDGKPFPKTEKKHIHEKNKKLMQKARKKHLQLAKEFKWIKINANQLKDKVFEDIKKEIDKILS
ncbi:hypothetical protein KY331_06370 [Candidatus Woesearchaeota archaeon]|nr:hypothetical protein [Candidatus Woesearchaeota archaeon]